MSTADAEPRQSWSDALAVYFKPRVLIVLLLGFSAGLPFSLAGQTLQAWMTESGVNIQTIGLFAAVGSPYWAKPLWSPAVDALGVPPFSNYFGQRRGWLILTQLMLAVSVVLLALCEPTASPLLVAGAALLVTTASATQDIVIDAFRIESLKEDEQAAGMASYVAAYRVAVLISGAGALFLVTGFEQMGFDKQGAYHAMYFVMATLILVGIIATLLAVEPEKSPAARPGSTTTYLVIVAFIIAAMAAAAILSYIVSLLTPLIGKAATYLLLMTPVVVLIGVLIVKLRTLHTKKSAKTEADHAEKLPDDPWQRIYVTAAASLSEFLSRDSAVAVLAFVTLFKLADALASALTTPFVLETGFTRVELATIIKGVGFAAAIIGGFAGGYLARALPLATSLWIGGILQAVAILAFSWQAVVGVDAAWLTFAITAENFTSGIGTVIFVAYLSALCGNPLHTATQYALLTALTALGRTVFALGTGYLAAATGWVAYFAICAATAIPSFILLAWLQQRGHFATLKSPSQK